ncbi:MAG: leucine-rich repeat domain-containing protein [Bacteroidales bacterium]|nr:leucine-rich repeat domain-containing protein [Bacteroidales bacterium]
MKYELNKEKNGLLVVGGEDGEEQLIIPSEQVFEEKTYLVTEIRAGAFSSCQNTKEIIIPKTIRWIDGDAFASSGLEKICVADDNPFYCSINGIVYNKSQTVLVAAAPLLARDMLVVPDGVQKIAEGAFRDCVYLTDIILPESLVIIGDDAFSGCHRLTAIDIPDSVTKIGESCFKDCKKLKVVSLSKGLTEITFGVFASCDELRRITIPHGIKVLGECAFDACNSLIEVILPDTLEEIESFALGECYGLYSITIPSSVKRIDESAFDSSEFLQEITIADPGLLKDVWLPDNVEIVKP